MLSVESNSEPSFETSDILRLNELEPGTRLFIRSQDKTEFQIIINPDGATVGILPAASKVITGDLTYAEAKTQAFRDKWTVYGGVEA